MIELKYLRRLFIHKIVCCVIIIINYVPIFNRKLKRDSMGNNNEVVITDTDRLLLQKDEEVT